jgi:hypothetical protein
VLDLACIACIAATCLSPGVTLSVVLLSVADCAWLACVCVLRTAACRHASVEDFGFMSDDDIGAITGCMTAVEGSRFKAAIAKQSSAQEEEEE